ncbi:MAG TPA: hypothetical protein VL282_18530 [Tepidisphaeraceae bacterium]|jgi:hypothetical protein|nr:hypothetical protein [Tepidisphaeraceae bacterium]
MRISLLILLTILVAFPLYAMNPDGLGIGASSSSHSTPGSWARSNWYHVEAEVDRGNRRVIDNATWTLDEIHLSRALVRGQLREFDLLQIERDRMERIEARERMLRQQSVDYSIRPLPRGNTLRGGYLGMIYNPMDLIYPRGK